MKGALGVAEVCARQQEGTAEPCFVVSGNFVFDFPLSDARWAQRLLPPNVTVFASLGRGAESNRTSSQLCG